MGSYNHETLKQLNYGKGEVLYGDTPLAILKALLQSGISYIGGYPGSPTAGLIDVISDSYDITSIRNQLHRRLPGFTHCRTA